MASGSSAPFRCIIHVLGRPRCGLCCVKKRVQLSNQLTSASLIFENIKGFPRIFKRDNQNKAEPRLVQKEII
jgi:hypothetical protein